MSIFSITMIGAVIFLLIFFFAWALCAGADSDIGIDEDAEQDEWFREYTAKKQKKMEEKNLRRQARMKHRL